MISPVDKLRKLAKQRTSIKKSVNLNAGLKTIIKKAKPRKIKVEPQLSKSEIVKESALFKARKEVEQIKLTKSEYGEQNKADFIEANLQADKKEVVAETVAELIHDKPFELVEHETLKAEPKKEEERYWSEEPLRATTTEIPKTPPSILLDEYEIPCSCPGSKYIKRFISRYDCQKCNPLKQEDRDEERKSLIEQIKVAYKRLEELNAIDGISSNLTLVENKAKKDNRSFIEKMLNIQYTNE